MWLNIKIAKIMISNVTLRTLVAQGRTRKLRRGPTMDVRRIGAWGSRIWIPGRRGKSLKVGVRGSGAGGAFLFKVLTFHAIGFVHVTTSAIVAHQKAAGSVFPGIEAPLTLAVVWRQRYRHCTFMSMVERRHRRDSRWYQLPAHARPLPPAYHN